MSLNDLELRGVKLPEKEACLGDLSANQIVEKVNQYQERLRRECHLKVAPFAEAYFLNLIALYPISMCSRCMTDALKLVAALFYFGSKPTQDLDKDNEELNAKELFPSNKPSPAQSGYSYEDLALVFDRTRMAIVEAVRQKQKEAKIILEEAKLRCESGKSALEELTEEEKQALSWPKNEENRRTSLPC